jgi:hypothetical protein
MGPGLGGQDETGDDRLWPDVRDRIDELETCEAGLLSALLGCSVSRHPPFRLVRPDLVPLVGADELMEPHGPVHRDQ